MLHDRASKRMKVNQKGWRERKKAKRWWDRGRVKKTLELPAVRGGLNYIAGMLALSSAPTGHEGELRASDGESTISLAVGRCLCAR